MVDIGDTNTWPGIMVRREYRLAMHLSDVYIVYMCIMIYIYIYITFVYVHILSAVNTDCVPA